jgi:hypothetical protein
MVLKKAALAARHAKLPGQWDRISGGLVTRVRGYFVVKEGT